MLIIILIILVPTYGDVLSMIQSVGLVPKVQHSFLETKQQKLVTAPKLRSLLQMACRQMFG